MLKLMLKNTDWTIYAVTIILFLIGIVRYI